MDSVFQEPETKRDLLTTCEAAQYLRGGLLTLKRTARNGLVQTLQTLRGHRYTTLAMLNESLVYEKAKARVE